MKRNFVKYAVLLLVLTFAFSMTVSNVAAAKAATITGRIVSI